MITITIKKHTFNDETGSAIEFDRVEISGTILGKEKTVILKQANKDALSILDLILESNEDLKATYAKSDGTEAKVDVKYNKS